MTKPSKSSNTAAGKRPLRSNTYHLFKRAIRQRKQLVFNYQGHRREVCPHVLGTTFQREKAFVFQFAGTTASGLPTQGQWRCIHLDGVTGAHIRDGAWHTADGVERQTCVADIDVQVTTARRARFTGERARSPAASKQYRNGDQRRIDPIREKKLGRVSAKIAKQPPRNPVVRLKDGSGWLRIGVAPASVMRGTSYMVRPKIKKAVIDANLGNVTLLVVTLPLAVAVI